MKKYLIPVTLLLLTVFVVAQAPRTPQRIAVMSDTSGVLLVPTNITVPGGITTTLGLTNLAQPANTISYADSTHQVVSLPAQTANTFLAGPGNGQSGAATFRSLAGKDFPSLTIPVGSLSGVGFNQNDLLSWNGSLFSSTPFVVITNTIFQQTGFDTNVATYCNTLGIQDATVRGKINSSIMALRRYGLMSSVVDIWLLRSNLNNGTLQSFFLNYGTNIGSPYLSEDGLVLNGTSTAEIFPLPNGGVTNHTFICWLRGITNQPDANPVAWSVANSAGMTTAGIAPIGGNNTFGTMQLYTRQGGTALQNPLWYQSATNQGWAAWDARYKSVGYGYNGVSASYYVDGLLGVPIAGVVQTTSPLTHLFLGEFSTGFSSALHWWGGTMSYAIMFNRQLSYTECQQVEQAMRYLEPSDENLLFVGDSTSYQNFNDSPNKNWPRQFEMGAGTNRYRIYSVAYSGLRATDFDTTWPGGDHYMTNAFMYGRGGAVKKATAIMYLGINDLYVSGTGPQPDSQTISTVSNCWNELRNSGFELIGATVHSIYTNATVTWKPTMEQSRSNLNNFIITNFPGVYLCRLDASFGDSEMVNGGTFSVDGLHLTDQGYNRWARMFAAQPRTGFMGGVENAYMDYTNNYAYDGDQAYYLGNFFIRSNGVWMKH